MCKPSKTFKTWTFKTCAFKTWAFKTWAFKTWAFKTWALLGLVALAATATTAARSEEYPANPGEVGGTVSARRPHPHSSADHGPVPLRPSRQEIRDRQPARRRQQHRHRGGGEFPAGRLHDPLGQSRQRHQCDAVQAAAVQL